MLFSFFCPSTAPQAPHTHANAWRWPWWSQHTTPTSKQQPRAKQWKTTFGRVDNSVLFVSFEDAIAFQFVIDLVIHLKAYLAKGVLRHTGDLPLPPTPPFFPDLVHGPGNGPQPLWAAPRKEQKKKSKSKETSKQETSILNQISSLFICGLFLERSMAAPPRSLQLWTPVSPVPFSSTPSLPCYHGLLQCLTPWCAPRI